MGIPGIARNFADPGQVRSQEIGQRLDRFGVGCRIAIGALVDAFRDVAPLVRHHGADDFQQAHPQRMLEREPGTFALGFFPQVALQGAFEKRPPFRHPRHLVVENQRRRPVDPLDLFHRIAAVMGFALFAPGALASRCRAVDPFPVGLVARRRRRCRRQRRIAGENVVRGHDGNRETAVDIRVRYSVVVAETQAGEHRKPVAVEPFVAGDMNPRVEPHLADMAGHTGRNFQRPHFVGRIDRAIDPFARQVAVIGQARMGEQHHHRMVVPVDGICPGQPGIVRNAADADLARIHEIGTALDIDGPPFEIGRHRRFFLDRFALDEAGEQIPVLGGRPAKFSGRAGCRLARRLGAVAFDSNHRLVAVNNFEGIGAEMERPVPGRRI